MSLGRYTATVLAIVGAGLALAWLLGLRNLEPKARWAAAFGAALAAVNTVAAYGLVLWSTGRSTTTFLSAVLGGMVGRMGLMLLAVIVGVLALDLPKVPLALSLLSFFVLFLVMELTVLHKHVPAREASR